MTKLTLLTAGHLATCPRMVKAADALSCAGHDVHLISTSFVAWAREADEALAARRPWRWTRISFERDHARSRQMQTALWTRAARAIAGRAAAHVPHRLVVRAYAPYSAALVRSATAEPTDLVYGGTSGALHAACQVGAKLGVPFGVDLEDFHVAEQGGPDADLDHALADRILTRVFPQAAFRTAAGEPIAQAYEARYGQPCVSINNVFPLEPEVARTPRVDGPLRLYWFSQTLGPGRGLEDVVAAAGQAQQATRLTLRGRADAAYVASLQAHAAQVAGSLEIVHQPPGPPDAMVALCREHDVGLALEQVAVPNRDICLTNKLFAFIAAGMPIVGTATTAQRPILESLGAGAMLVPPGDVEALAGALRHWHEDRAGLARAGACVAEAAQARWHWEHADEREALIRTVQGALR